MRYRSEAGSEEGSVAWFRPRFVRGSPKLSLGRDGKDYKPSFCKIRIRKKKEPCCLNGYKIFIIILPSSIRNLQVKWIEETRICDIKIGDGR